MSERSSSFVKNAIACLAWLVGFFPLFVSSVGLIGCLVLTLQESQSGFDHFMQSAQSVLAEAIASGAAEKLLSGILSPNQNQQGFSPQNAQYGQYPHGPPPQQRSQDQRGGFNMPQVGGEGSVGGFGSVGSFLSNLARDVLQPQQPQGGQNQYGHRGQF